MPNYTIYVSASNDHRFKDEPNKSGLINELLETAYMDNVHTAQAVPQVVTLIDKKTFAEAVPITEKNKDMDFCKHGAVKGFCKKGCK